MLKPNPIDDAVEVAEEVLDDLFEQFPYLVEQAERNYGPDR